MKEAVHGTRFGFVLSFGLVWICDSILFLERLLNIGGAELKKLAIGGRFERVSAADLFLYCSLAWLGLLAFFVWKEFIIKFVQRVFWSTRFEKLQGDLNLMLSCQQVGIPRSLSHIASVAHQPIWTLHRPLLVVENLANNNNREVDPRN